MEQQESTGRTEVGCQSENPQLEICAVLSIFLSRDEVKREQGCEQQEVKHLDQENIKTELQYYGKKKVDLLLRSMLAKRKKNAHHQPFLIHRDSRGLHSFFFQINSKPRYRRCKSLVQYHRRRRIEREVERRRVQRELFCRTSTGIQHDNPTEPDVEMPEVNQKQPQVLDTKTRGNRFDWIDKVLKMSLLKGRKVVKVIGRDGEFHVLDYEQVKTHNPAVICQFFQQQVLKHP